ncbi:hypothetical protein [Hymenobacter nivis]|uniref:Uncharacterized protein n=1 Tax=Hymenobacter nivis TaxID=1850093 RepID=A0A2Z3GUJ9_9BACT|nr:hypothetical protein [Hymenobacter nivis]AWM35126.1 hypothetical protein DDQ68_21570 [Hymenobacter nivis]
MPRSATPPTPPRRPPRAGCSSAQRLRQPLAQGPQARPEGPGQVQQPRALNLAALYAAAQAVPLAGAPRNIEAAAATGTELLLLLQRGGGAAALRLLLAAVLVHLGGLGPPPRRGSGYQ